MKRDKKKQEKYLVVIDDLLKLVDLAFQQLQGVSVMGSPSKTDA